MPSLFLRPDTVSLLLLWAACAVLLLRLGKKLTVGKFSLRRIVRNDEGAAYSLNLAILTPFYTLLVCLLIELTLLLNVQIGVDYAAFAAARSAAVWLCAETTSETDEDDLVQMVELAADALGDLQAGGRLFELTYRAVR